MSLVLASLTLLGLGIFGPSIAAGLVTGAPQLGAGAAVGTVGAAAGTALLAASAIGGAGRALMGGASSIKSASNMGGTKDTGTGSGTPSGGGPQQPPPTLQSSSASLRPSGDTDPKPDSASQTPSGPSPSRGAQTSASTAQGAVPSDPPDWAAKIQAEQRLRSHLHLAQSAIASGDQPSGSAHPDLSQKE